MSGDGYTPSVPVRVDGVVDRRDLIVRLATGRRVLHLGCVDDRLTEHRLITGELLHARLAAVAAELVGVDLSASGIELLRRELPGKYLVGDVELLLELDLPVPVDLVIASELIEHLANPGLFLAGLREYLKATGATAIVTTPNSYSWAQFVRFSFHRREWTHPDHRLIFSPYTLAATMSRSGLRVEQLLIHAWNRDGRWRSRIADALDRAVLRWHPALGLGLVVVVRAGSIVRPRGD